MPSSTTCTNIVNLKSRALYFCGFLTSQPLTLHPTSCRMKHTSAQITLRLYRRLAGGCRALLCCHQHTRGFRPTNCLTFPHSSTTSTLSRGLPDDRMRIEETYCCCVWGGGHWSTFFILLFLRSLLYSCTHFLNGNSCQNVAGLQHTAQLRLALEPGTKQEARRGEACWEYYSRMVSWGNRL